MNTKIPGWDLRVLPYGKRLARSLTETPTLTRVLRALALCLIDICSGDRLAATTFTVTSTADSGAGTLRQAIVNANNLAGTDTIAFNIAGSGVHTINLAMRLPEITDAVTIDGYTQPGSLENTLPAGQGLNTVLKVAVRGSWSGSVQSCLKISASDVIIKGLVIQRCIEVVFSSGESSKVEGCFIGTNPAGTRIEHTFDYGQIHISSQSAVVGGTTPAARNLIAGCGVHGSSSATGHQIRGNRIGLKASSNDVLDGGCEVLFPGMDIGGTNALIAENTIARAGSGIELRGTGHTVRGNVIDRIQKDGISVTGSDHTIGGPNAGEANFISGARTGITLGGSGTTVQGNSIGAVQENATGILVSGSDHIVGGIGAGEANTIAFNGGGAGVAVSGERVTIRGNRIYANVSESGPGLGIELEPVGIQVNDPGDVDSGANGLQNYPILLSAGPAVPEGSGTHITGILNSRPSTTFDIDFYSNPACTNRPQEFLEARDYMGSTQVTTNGSGNASFDITLPLTVEPGARITATATDLDGNTSELSQRIVFSIEPTSGPPAGGTGFTINGMLFEDGATVTVGGVPATDVDVVDSTTITAATPALSPGTANDVTVTNPSGIAGTLLNGWIADFADVPENHPFHLHVIKLVASGITAGCGAGLYCPSDSVTRAQMAVLLLRAKNGLCYAPPDCTGIFPDVPCPSLFANWIEALAAAGITAGCGGGNYCPDNPVTRDQMAVLLLKTRNGVGYTPPTCAGLFDDVECLPTPAFAVDWIEQLYNEGITGGCGATPLIYCPGNAATRGQMAVFLVKTFNLQ